MKQTLTTAAALNSSCDFLQNVVRLLEDKQDELLRQFAAIAGDLRGVERINLYNETTIDAMTALTKAAKIIKKELTKIDC